MDLTPRIFVKGMEKEKELIALCCYKEIIAYLCTIFIFNNS